MRWGLCAGFYLSWAHGIMGFGEHWLVEGTFPHQGARFRTGPHQPANKVGNKRCGGAEFFARRRGVTELRTKDGTLFIFQFLPFILASWREVMPFIFRFFLFRSG
jgi:hypothetical protein